MPNLDPLFLSIRALKGVGVLGVLFHYIRPLIATLLI